MMFPQSDEMDAKAVGQNCLVHDVAQDVIHRLWLSIDAKAHVSERIKAKLHLRHL